MATDAYIDKIVCGDNVEIMRNMDDDSIDLTVTSPPYDNLRTYNGYSWDFESVAQELYRITKPGGVVVWVVNDATIKGSETLSSFKQALYFREIGFNVHDTMIYHKNGGTPYYHNRYQPSFEYMFVFSKGKPKTFNVIREPARHGGKRSTLTQRQRTGQLTVGNGHGKIRNTHKYRDNVWTIDVGFMKTTKDRIAYKHPAIFPEQLARDHIVSWSNPGDIVLDPFGGSGTTAKMAIAEGRRYIHIDISEEYCEIARKRIEQLGKTGNRAD